MKYALTVGGVFSGRVEEFDSQPDPNPSKGLAWIPYVEQTDPVIDPATHKLGPVEFDVVGGEVRRSRPAVALTAQEKIEHVIRNRGAGYQSGTLGLKGVQGDQVTVLGFWIDAMAEQLDAIMQAQSITPTAELQALLSMRATVKAANPKPS